ncbi:MAG: pilus assembly protein, partial [Blautia obeum]|nr:pilus assembly protein [Blautia obeum]
MVGQLRNKSGEKYHACERCRAGSAGSVYITGEGNRYHGSLSCSGLKRTVEEVLQKDCGLRPCSK